MSRDKTQPGAINRDGDRKSWDARGPMISDNVSIFRTNCAILTSYIRAHSRILRNDKTPAEYCESLVIQTDKLKTFVRINFIFIFVRREFLDYSRKLNL